MHDTIRKYFHRTLCTGMTVVNRKDLKTHRLLKNRRNHNCTLHAAFLIAIHPKSSCCNLHMFYDEGCIGPFGNILSKTNFITSRKLRERVPHGLGLGPSAQNIFWSSKITILQCSLWAVGTNTLDWALLEVSLGNRFEILEAQTFRSALPLALVRKIRSFVFVWDIMVRKRK